MSGKYTLILSDRHVSFDFNEDTSIQQALDRYAVDSRQDLTDARVQLRGIQVDPDVWETTILQDNDTLVVLTSALASGGFKGAQAGTKLRWLSATRS